MKTTLAERKRHEAEHEAKIASVLLTTGKRLDAARRERRKKKKSPGELYAMLDMAGLYGKVLRAPNEYKCRSYNLDRQLHDLIAHLFVKYPVPSFMYQACLVPPSGDRFACMSGLHKEWFITMAQGGSFTKAVKGAMTSKEAYAFLHAPAANSIPSNVWWAKMRVAGLPLNMAEKLLSRILSSYYFDDPNGRLAETIQFYARYGADMDRDDFAEITDFLAWKLANDRAFSLKGRTLSSVTKLTNQWHVEIQKAKLGSLIKWPGRGLRPWTVVRKDCIWEAVELLTNHELINEGRKQQHCVSSYVSWCSQGRSTIVSMRQFTKELVDLDEAGAPVRGKGGEISRATIEVASDGRIVQMKGRMNRPVSHEQSSAILQWRGELGFTVGRAGR